MSTKAVSPTLRIERWNFSEIWQDIVRNVNALLMDPFVPAPRSFPSLDRAVHKLVTGDSCMEVPVLADTPPGLDGPTSRCYIIHALLRKTIETHLRENVLPKLKNQLELSAAGGCGEGGPFLDLSVAQFERFTLSMRLITVIFRYFRSQVQRMKGIQWQHDLTTLGYQVWKEVVFDATEKNYMDEILHAISVERMMGLAADKFLLRRALICLAALSCDSRNHLYLYKLKFEVPFLAETQRYYMQQQARMQLLPTLAEYTAEAERLILLELKRIHDYVDRSTQPPLLKLVIATLVESRMDELLVQFTEWICNHSITELRRLFWLVCHSETGFDPLRKSFEDKIDADGCAEIQRCAEDAAKDPATLMRCVFKVFANYDQLVVSVFDNHVQLRKALEQGARRFINRNALYPHSTAKAAEVIAKYCNLALKPSSTLLGDEPIDALLTRIVGIFKLLEDKDVFQQYHGSLLAIRLIYGNFDSDAESLMITKMREECGHEFTYKWQRMFVDATTNAKLLREEFGTFLAGEKGVRAEDFEFFSPLILMHGSWPISPPTDPIPRLAQFIPSMEIFEKFYTTKYKGRKLAWIPAFSHGVVRTARPLNTRHYEFALGYHQLAVLLAVEMHPKGAVLQSEVFSTLTQDEITLMEKAIHALQKAKLILVTPGNKNDSLLSLNLNYANAQRKVNLLVSRETKSLKNPKDETGNVAACIATDRKYAIQAAIVRVMKSRRTLSHSQLISQVCAALAARFQAVPHDVKNNIDVLIEKEYLERSAEDRNTYVYMA